MFCGVRVGKRPFRLMFVKRSWLPRSIGHGTQCQLFSMSPAITSSRISYVFNSGRLIRNKTCEDLLS